MIDNTIEFQGIHTHLPSGRCSTLRDSVVLVLGLGRTYLVMDPNQTLL